MNTFRTLCAELADIVTAHCNPDDYAVSDCAALLARARAELAKPEPEFTVEEVEMIQAPWSYLAPAGPTRDELRAMAFEFAARKPEEFARAVLARWGRPATDPTPVSEQPWEREGWCDAQGTCWMWHPTNFHYCLCRPDPSVHTHSLPHWVLPLPIPAEAGELSPREVEAQEAFTEMRDEILSRSDGLGVNEVLSIIDNFTPGWV
jgi:hypothetical protein